MRLDRIQALALALPHTTVVKQWGEHLVFKVAEKMFLIVGLDGQLVDGVTCKCTPDEFDELTETDGFIQAPYCAKRHWFQIEDVSVVSESRLQALIRRSYDLVVAGLPKKKQRELGIPVS